MDILHHNAKAWDKRVQEHDMWTVPVDADTIRRARQGNFALVLTPIKPVPMEWFPPLNGLPTLCLASGGGQQGPLLAAAGAQVTVLDNSPLQLAQDQLVAERESLDIKTVKGDMANLSAFDDNSFGLIVHPCSNCFCPDILPVWRECFRVLRPGGVLLAGFCNPARYLFEDTRLDNGVLVVRYPVPHSDVDELDDPHLKRRILEELDAFEFGHSLTDQIDGQLRCGFQLTAMYEDRFGDFEADPISRYMDTFIATRAVKPAIDG
ncbi:class I SAM-dependent methyltransferase [Aeoliella sp. ICT_H6.2]|uniref:Class I SAM-dependent methyltransferase n=1 Tax=Aeoliella straminimaris TaxID=2954799 RepID=A0A9X2JGP2_9BACT|nr:class I SAM-dependent methyltransferase [Aeoliella straminimaris]MCO6044951.1 class I SAM-dependent methyltransferase [Aeoliella straminimaris]